MPDGKRAAALLDNLGGDVSLDPKEDSGEDGGLSGQPTVLAARKQPAPIDEFSGWIKENTRRFMRLTAKLTRYIDHWEYEDDGEVQHLPAEKFLHLVELVALDIFTATPEATKARRVGAPSPAELAWVREHPCYESIKRDITTKVTALRDGDNLGVFAPFFESAAAFETAQNMFFAKKERDRIAATAEFLDRVAPKKSRGDGNTLVVVIPPGQEETMRRTMEIMGTSFGETDPLISAKTVRVPQITGD